MKIRINHELARRIRHVIDESDSAYGLFSIFFDLSEEGLRKVREFEEEHLLLSYCGFIAPPESKSALEKQYTVSYYDMFRNQVEHTLYLDDSDVIVTLTIGE